MSGQSAQTRNPSAKLLWPNRRLAALPSQKRTSKAPNIHTCSICPPSLSPTAPLQQTTNYPSAARTRIFRDECSTRPLLALTLPESQICPFTKPFAPLQNRHCPSHRKPMNLSAYLRNVRCCAVARSCGFKLSVKAEFPTAYIQRRLS